MNAYASEAGGESTQFVHLVMQRIPLLLPQGDVQLLETAADMHPPRAGIVHSVGCFEKDGRIWPVYVLSADLAPQLEMPEDYKTAVLLQNGDRAFGLLCRQVHLIENSRLVLHELPACMKTPHTPSLALYGEALLMVSSAKALGSFLLDDDDGTILKQEYEPLFLRDKQKGKTINLP